jgi:hypothetical protein
MDQFMPRFRKDGTDISKTEDGWLVGGDILVAWDGSNHPVDVAQTHVVSGGSTVEADSEKEARDISFTIPDDPSAVAPDGRMFDLQPVEVKFLATVGLILDRNPTHYGDDVVSAISDSTITAFTDTKSGLHHGHGLNKHRIQDLGVTDECAGKLYYNSHDHAGVWEMAVREQEFRNAPFDVFEDADNDDSRKWEKINSTKEKAPIPKSVRSNLTEMFE